jgi:hypothetical protein
MALNLDPPVREIRRSARFSALIFRLGFLGDIRSRAGADFEKFGYLRISKGWITTDRERPRADTRQFSRPNIHKFGAA